MIGVIALIIHSITMMFILFNNKQLRNSFNKLKEDIAVEKFERQTFIKQHNKEIKTLSVMYNKTLDCATKSFISTSDYTFMKENVAKEVVQYIIENNLIQTEEFDTYYKCSIAFVKA